MKKMLALLTILFSCPVCRAQNVREWLRQNRTQKQYLQTQIAELKLYYELTKTGYQIAKEGLTLIHDLKNGEFKLHKNRFDSLYKVKPQIGSMGVLKEITDLHGRVNDLCELLPEELSKSGHFDTGQLLYVRKVLALLYEDCQHVLNNLFLVIHSGNLSATDDERIARILLCHRQMQSNYLFIRSFQSQMKMLVIQHAQRSTQINQSRALHGLN